MFALEAILLDPRRHVEHIHIIYRLVEFRQVDILVTKQCRGLKAAVAEVSLAGSEAQFFSFDSVFLHNIIQYKHTECIEYNTDKV